MLLIATEKTIYMLLKILNSIIYLCVDGNTYVMVPADVRRQFNGVRSLFPQCGSWGLNSVCQT